MSNKKQLKGTCAYCGAEIIKNMSIRHLANCAGRKHVIAEAGSAKRKSETLYHLRIQAVGMNEFWLEFETVAKAFLQTVSS